MVSGEIVLVWGLVLIRGLVSLVWSLISLVGLHLVGDHLWGVWILGWVLNHVVNCLSLLTAAAAWWETHARSNAARNAADYKNHDENNHENVQG